MHSKNMQSKNMHACMQSKYAHLRPLRKSDGGSAGRSESRTVAPLAAQKSDVGGFRGGGNPGRGKSLKTDFPY